MSTWREIELGELCERVTVGHVGKMADQYVDDGVPFLRSQNINPFRINTDGMLRIDDEFHRKLSKSELRSGDVAIIRTGYPGTAAVVPPELDGSNCADLVIVTPSDELNPHMLAAVLNSSWGRSAVGGHLVGAAQQHFNVGSAKRLLVRLPDRADQDSIAAVLSAFNDLLENNRRRVEVLEAMARAIYREWFVHFRFPGHDHASVVDSALGPIPEDWSWRPFTDVASFMNGFAFKPAHLGDEGRPVIKIKQLKDGVSKDTPRSDADAINEKYWIEPGDLLMSWSAHLGVYWWMDEPGLLNQHLFKVSAVAEYPELYLFYDLDRAMPQFWDRAQGTTMRHIKRAALSEVHALAADVRMVEHFVDSVAPLVASAMRLRNAAAELHGLRDLLLPKLVTGQIDVSDLDLDAIVEKAGV